MRKSKISYSVLYLVANSHFSYIVPGLGDFGDRFYTM